MTRVVPMIVAAAALLAVPAMAGESDTPGGVKAGVLTCNVDSGWGLVFGSSRGLNCTFAKENGPPERYTGKIMKFGVDLGYSASSVMIWTVLAPTSNTGPGGLAGEYGGATGSATIGVGVGANVLLGGSNKSIALQPLSIEGSTGLNVAGGIAALTLDQAS